MANLDRAIEELERFIPDASAGLGEEIFLLISRTTPLVNVDLLIVDAARGILLTWRDDGYGPPGWHIPGGILRLKESWEERIAKTAKNELGTEVRSNPAPLAINQCILAEQKNRGHFISLLFRCELMGAPAESLRCVSAQPSAGEWMWHKGCPQDIIPQHRELYGRLLEDPRV